MENAIRRANRSGAVAEDVPRQPDARRHPAWLVFGEVTGAAHLHGAARDLLSKRRARAGSE